MQAQADERSVGAAGTTPSSPSQPLHYIDAELSAINSHTRRSDLSGSLIERSTILRRLLAYDKAQKLYDKVRMTMRYVPRFSAAVLDTMGIQLDVNRHELIRIPREGACLICSNHPHGAIDGVLLLEMVLGLRTDVKIIANDILNSIPELSAHVIPMDLSSKSSSRNVASMREALRWLQQGGALIVFPAGEISHLNLYSGRIADGAWSESIGRLASLAKACVVPVFIHGTNSTLFQIVGLVHPRLRTTMILRELVRLKPQRIRVRIGTIVQPRHYIQHPAHHSIADFLRSRSLLLKYRATEQRGSADIRIKSGAQIEKPISRSCMLREIAHLPKEQRLYDSGEYLVVRAHAAQIPKLLREVGRLRELSFRLVGEGTMQSVDLDSFDSLYEHLILWHRERQEIVGAYRIGRCDELVRRFGKRGLYLHTLFDLSDEFLRRIGPALELGRSFVRPEYQRNGTALQLLWKGIGALLVQRPEYRSLIGPVSISNDYSLNSQRVLVASLTTHHYHAGLARLVRARTPLPKKVFANWDALLHKGTVLVLEQAAALVENLEWDARGVPPLLRHYIKLGGRVVAFNRDHQFASCLDALVVVDVCAIESRMLSRFLGNEGAQSYAAFHGLQTVTMTEESKLEAES